jgi:hypothetical protein
MEEFCYETSEWEMAPVWPRIMSRGQLQKQQLLRVSHLATSKSNPKLKSEHIKAKKSR